MSSGAFTLSKYEADNGDIHPIRLQPETLSANVGSANTAPTGTVTVSLFASARKNKRAYGLGARTVRVKFTGSAPDDYEPNQILTIPVLTRTVFDAVVVGGTGTYLGSPIQIVGKSPESAR